ncbi:MAG: hypothetical protein P9M14_08290, partial [Candidatus Alcyoniella australis]|nr:hypothetical protein [Candidatus Alcyoniella australis]
LGLDCYSGEVLGELEVHDVGRPLRRGLAPQSQSEDRPAMLTFIRVDPDRNRLYATSDYSGNLIVIDLQSRAELRRLQVEGSVHHFTVDPRNGRLLIVGGGGKLFVADPDTLEPVQFGAVPGLLIFHVALDEQTGRILVSSFFAGKVWIYDPQTLQRLGEIYLGPGVRFMADVPGPGVAVSNFFSGRLELIDAQLMISIGSTRTGRRTRWLEPTLDGRGLSTVSSRGPLLIDLDKLSEWP